MKLGAKELREVDEKRAKDRLKKLKRKQIYLILEDVYDTYNVGGLFRLADALAVEKMYLCGETEIPPNSRIKKASVGTYKVVPWEYKKSVKEAILSLRAERSNLKKDRLPRRYAPRNDSIQIIAVEQDKRAVAHTEAKYSLPLALVVGNETSGVGPETLKLCDQIVEIPMWGINKSLNVIVSAAIVGFWVASKIKS